MAISNTVGILFRAEKIQSNGTRTLHTLALGNKVSLTDLFGTRLLPYVSSPAKTDDRSSITEEGRGLFSFLVEPRPWHTVTQPIMQPGALESIQWQEFCGSCNEKSSERKLCLVILVL